MASELPQPSELIARRIHVIRGQMVMIDSDLAELYQVPVQRLNAAVRRHRERFPEDFLFPLTASEAAEIGRRGKRYAFTQAGLAMLSSVLTSKQGVQMSVLIKHAFDRVHEVLGGRVARLEYIQQLYDAALMRLVEGIQPPEYGDMVQVWRRRKSPSRSTRRRSAACKTRRSGCGSRKARSCGRPSANSTKDSG